jgi:hypothetical protein
MSTDCAAVLLDIYSSVGFHDNTLRTPLALKKGPFFSFTVKLLLVSQVPFSSAGCCNHTLLTKQKNISRMIVFFPELLSDRLSDVPDDISSEGECERGNDDSVRKIKIVAQEQSSSDINKTSNEGATSCLKEDKTPKLGPFTGNPVVKQIPCNPGETRYICKFCLVPLHKGECFQR